MTPRSDDPRCDHGRSEVRVTNQTGAWDRTRPHASVWVCSAPACVLDAMAWVTRVTSEKPWWQVGVGGGWRDENPGGEL